MVVREGMGEGGARGGRSGIVSLSRWEQWSVGPGRRGERDGWAWGGAGGVPVAPRGGACPNLPQRRSGSVSAVSGGAEYQRFFSCAPARSGPLWQIWTIRRRGPVGEGVRGSGGGRCGRPDDRGDHFDDPTGPAGAPVREGPRHPARSRPPGPVPGVSPIPGPRQPVPDFSRARRFLVERAPPVCAFDWKSTRSRKDDGPGVGEPAAECALPAGLGQVFWCGVLSVRW